VKADDTVVPRTLTAGSNITITIGDTTITFDATGGSGGGGGSLVLLDEQVASSSASLDMVTGINDTYDEYELRFALVPATDNVQLRARLSSDGGSNWDAGASDYRWIFKRSRDGSAGFDIDATDQADSMLPLTNNVGSDTGEGVTGVLRFPTLRNTTLRKLMLGDLVNVSDAAEVARHFVAGMRVSSAAFNGIRLLFDSGNIESGWARLYGVAKTPSGSGAIVLYDSGALGSPAASIDTGAAGIAGGYTVLEVWALLRTDQAVAASTIDVRVNNDSSAVYSYQRLTGANATASANVVAGATSWQISAVGASMASGVFHVIRMTIPFYTETVAHKAAEVLHGRHDTTAANGSIEARALRWASTAAITRMAFIAPSTFNFIAGSHVIIYGR
jgi:hypothetical protein